MQKDSSRRRFPLADRVIEVIDDTLTGEVLLDEALKMMKSSEKMSVNSWIDLMSGTPGTLAMANNNVVEDSKMLTHISFRPNRRDLEPDEDRLPIETSARATGQGPCG
jgi:hypothetical protein